MQFIALSDKPNTAAYFGGKRKPSEAEIGQVKWFFPAQSRGWGGVEWGGIHHKIIPASSFENAQNCPVMSYTLCLIENTSSKVDFVTWCFAGAGLQDLLPPSSMVMLEE